MKYQRIILFAIIVLMLSACKKDSENNNNLKPFSDFGVSYSEYQIGQSYTSDTFETRFTITNYGPSVFETGDTIFSAVRINNVVFGLDLIGTGPTPIVLSKPLAINEQYEYDPGYLIRSASLAYFALDTVDITILLYGQSGSPVDTTFPNDPTPGNNKATLRLTANNHYVVE